MKTLIKLVAFAFLCTQGFVSFAGKSKKTKLEKGIYAQINTSKGEILIQLEHIKTPMTVANFVGLAEGGIKNDAKALGVPFYDGLKFHRVINDFMVQGGDPKGNGSGDPGYKFYDEFDSTLTHSGPGILSMANSGPATNGSQFFITHKATPWLNNKHTVFGHVITGMDVINTIVKNDTILSVKIIRKGKEAKKFDAPEVFETMKIEYKRIEREKLEKARKEFYAFVNENYPTAIQAEEGYYYVITKEGNGEKPNKGQTITAHYTGKFTNGNVFDSSVKRGTPFQFPLGAGRVIKGWDAGFAQLSKGSKATLLLPYDMAYGERGSRSIPAKSTLIFDVELIDFK